MGLVSTLLGRASGDKKSAPRAAADVERARDDLAEKRAAAREQLAANAAARKRLLTVDESDEQISALDREVANLHLTLERCDELESIIAQEMIDLRDSARQAAWRKLRAEIDEASSAYADALLDLCARLRRVKAAYDSAEIAGFAGDLRSAYVAPPFVVDEFQANQFAAAIERAREIGRRGPTSKRQAASPVPGAQPARAASAQNTAKPIVPPAAAPQLAVAAPVVAAPRPDQPLPPHQILTSPPARDEDAKAWVIILTKGLESPLNQFTLHRLDYDRACALVRNSAAEFIAPPDAIPGPTAHDKVGA